MVSISRHYGCLVYANEALLLSHLVHVMQNNYVRYFVNLMLWTLMSNLTESTQICCYEDIIRQPGGGYVIVRSVIHSVIL